MSASDPDSAAVPEGPSAAEPRERDALVADLRRQLAEARDRYEFLIEATGLGDWDLNVAINRTRRSPRHDALFGYREMLPKWGYDDFLAHTHPDDREMVDRAYQRALGGEGTYDVEFRTTWPDGSVHWLWSRGRFILDDDGRPLRAAGVMSDITARKLAEEQLRRLDRDELVGKLAAGIAHDFNNQLSVILGAADFALAVVPEGAEPHEEIREIREAARKSANLVRELLALSRQELVRREPLDLVPLVARLRATLVHLVGEAIEVSCELPSEPAVVTGDARQLEQVLLNLAANARDAMPDGGRLVVSVATRADQVVWQVTDTGIGMEADTLARCREAFFTTKPRGRGTGLGLASVDAVVRQMGGTLGIESVPGIGTTVEVRLPRASTAPAAAAAPATSSVGQGRGQRVLVVDDDRGVREYMRRALEGEGYRVLVAASGEEAVRIALSLDTLDALVTDLVMPTMSGRAVAESVGARFPAAAILLVSGYSDDDIARTGVESGRWELLAKPFTPRELAARVSRLLERASAA